MSELTVGLLIRFLLGGAAVVVSTIIGRRLGEKAAGIFAAFPAVYLAALLTNRLDLSGNALINNSILLSRGAIIGMLINIIIAIIAGFLLRKGWKLGLLNVMACWFVFSIVAVIISSNS